MSSYRPHDITVDGIESIHEPYCQAGPHTVRHLYDIIDDQYLHKATQFYVADFIVDEDFYLSTGFIRDARSHEYYAVVVWPLEESWMSSVKKARRNYSRWVRVESVRSSRKAKVSVGKNK